MITSQRRTRAILVGVCREKSTVLGIESPGPFPINLGSVNRSQRESAKFTSLATGVKSEPHVGLRAHLPQHCTWRRAPYPPRSLKPFSDHSLLSHYV